MREHAIGERDVVEALDEQKHPLPHTTGPNWHIAYGQSQIRPSPLPPSNIHGLLDNMPPDGGNQMPPTYGSGPQMIPTPRVAGMEMPGTPAMSLGGQDASGPSSLHDILAGLPDQDPQPHHKAFGQGGKGWVIAGIIADALAKGFGGQGQFAPTYTGIQEENRANNQFNQRWQQKVAQDREDRLSEAELAVQKARILAQERRDNPAPGALQKDMQYLKTLNPRLTDDQLYAIALERARHPTVIANTPYGYDTGGGEDTGGDSGDAIADGPNGPIRYNPQTGQWEPM